ncbi:hypothetical protein [Lacrimispora sp.]|uniref:hypothetical protein n=1 Tax=Lacrimispora sp. TaxID=2719234 RepID=UPI0039E58D14
MRKYDKALFLIHVMVIIFELLFFLTLILGEGQGKWAVGAIGLSVGMFIVSLIVLWIQKEELKDSMKVIEKYNNDKAIPCHKTGRGRM